MGFNVGILAGLGEAASAHRTNLLDLATKKQKAIADRWSKEADNPDNRDEARQIAADRAFQAMMADPMKLPKEVMSLEGFADVVPKVGQSIQAPPTEPIDMTPPNQTFPQPVEIQPPTAANFGPGMFEPMPARLSQQENEATAKRQAGIKSDIAVDQASRIAEAEAASKAKHAIPVPRNMDPNSPEGIAARLRYAQEAEGFKAPPIPPVPAAVGEYKFYAEQETKAGRTPKSFDQWQTDDANRRKPAATDPAIRDLRIEGRVDAIRNQYNAHAVVKKYNVVQDAVQFVKGLDVNTKNPSDDQALIYAFAKAMDPDSVVREGEYATVQKYAQSWAEKFKFDALRIFSNTTFLTPEARNNMKATVEGRAKPIRQQYAAVHKDFVKRIEQVTGRDGNEYIPDYGAAFDAPPITNPSGTVSVQIPGHPPGEIPAAALEQFMKENPTARKVGP